MEDGDTRWVLEGEAERLFVTIHLFVY
jgi:hypothetical protein